MIEKNPYLTALGAISLGLITLAAFAAMFDGAAFALWAFGTGVSAGLAWLVAGALIWNARHSAASTAPAPQHDEV